MTKFSVGDRVRATSGSEPYYRDGDTGTIIGIFGETAEVDFDVPYVGQSEWYAPLSGLEKINESPVTPVQEDAAVEGRTIDLCDELDALSLRMDALEAAIASSSGPAEPLIRVTIDIPVSALGA